MRKNHWIRNSFIGIALLLMACASQNEPPRMQHIYTPQPLTTAVLRAEAPQKYQVKRGDTLWKIAHKFFINPAYWKEIWYANPTIKNPNHIYPNDILVIKSIGGKKRLTLLNRHSKPSKQAISTLPYEAINPFISKNHLFSQSDDLRNAPYIIASQDSNYLSLTNEDTIYAKGDHFDSIYYDVFRLEQSVIHPVSGKAMGVLGTYVGKLKISKAANADGIASFTQIDKHNPLYPKDILIPSRDKDGKNDGNYHFIPQRVGLNRTAFVVRSIGSSEGYISSQFSTLLLDIGLIDGVANGAVFNLVKGRPQIALGKDKQSYRLPDKVIATVIVYKTMPDSSYALVLSAKEAITPGDRVITPE